VSCKLRTAVLGSARGGCVKKTYERPAILHTEKLETRAVVCTKADASCSSGPIQS